MTDSYNARRIPWVALALSLLSMGVGHIYCGRIAKGLVLYVAWFAVPVIGLSAALLPATSLTLLACILLPAISIYVLYFYAAFDAFHSAKRSDPAYKLQDFNRAGIYWLLITVQLVCPVALTAAMRELVFEAFYIPTRSMNPSILQGDRVLVNKLTKRFPERGDVVVFYNPEPEGGHVFVKRVVALAGDTVVIDGEQVEINGIRLPRDPIPSEALPDLQQQPVGQAYYEHNAGRRYKVGYGDPHEPPEGRFELTVPDRSVFLLGDNRNRSRDSRHFGAIHVGDVLGFVQYTYFPAESWSRFGAYRD